MPNTHLYFLDKRFHDFQGVKVAFRRGDAVFVRYFSEREYGGAEAALRAAEEVRDAIVRLLEEKPDDPETVFASFRKPAPDLPPGLRPLRKQPGPAPASCTLRSSGPLADELDNICDRFQIGRTSVFKLALYALGSFLSLEGNEGLDVRQIVAKLESMRPSDAADWEEYSQDKKRGEGGER